MGGDAGPVDWEEPRRVAGVEMPCSADVQGIVLRGVVGHVAVEVAAVVGQRWFESHYGIPEAACAGTAQEVARYDFVAGREFGCLLLRCIGRTRLLLLRVLLNDRSSYE